MLLSFTTENNIVTSSKSFTIDNKLSDKSLVKLGGKMVQGWSLVAYIP